MAQVFIDSRVFENDENTLISRGQLKRVIRDLRENPEKGKPMRTPLQGCRSIRVGDCRVVHRSTTAGGETRVEIIVIQRRRNDEVYDEAKARLGR